MALTRHRTGRTDFTLWPNYRSGLVIKLSAPSAMFTRQSAYRWPQHSTHHEGLSHHQVHDVF
jgi:hypothetical protein